MYCNKYCNNSNVPSHNIALLTKYFAIWRGSNKSFGHEVQAAGFNCHILSTLLPVFNVALWALSSLSFSTFFIDPYFDCLCQCFSISSNLELVNLLFCIACHNALSDCSQIVGSIAAISVQGSFIFRKNADKQWAWDQQLFWLWNSGNNFLWLKINSMENS